jgi:hypothetical protein
MSLYVPAPGGFGWSVSNIAAGTQPGNNMGTSFTCAQNSMGTAVSLIAGSSVTTDVYGIWININSVNVQSSARQTSVDILYDPAGGTSWSVLVPNLLIGSPGTMTAGLGTYHYFPLYIKAGTSIGVQGSQANASPGTGYAWVRLYGRPQTQEYIRTGAFVERIGDSGTASGGTIITPGTASEGSWTLLGTTVKRLWYWQLGVGFNDTAMTGQDVVDLAVGDGTNMNIIIEDLPVYTTTNEVSGFPLHGVYADVPAGSNLYARVQASAADTISVAAYGVG